MVKEQVLDDEGLQKASCEVVLNIESSIATVTNEFNDVDPLTPNHMLLSKTNPIMPGMFKKEAIYPRKRQVQYIADMFRRRVRIHKKLE